MNIETFEAAQKYWSDIHRDQELLETIENAGSVSKIVFSDGSLVDASDFNLDHFAGQVIRMISQRIGENQEKLDSL